MLDSIRTRLTLWYTGVLALVLVVLFVITYLVLLRTVQRRMDNDLSELSKAFLATVRAELEDQSAPDPFTIAVEAAIAEHHFRDHVYAILDVNARLIARSTEDVPANASTRPDSGNLLETASFGNLSRARRMRNSTSGSLKERGAAIAGSPSDSPPSEVHTPSSSCALCTRSRRCSKK